MMKEQQTFEKDILSSQCDNMSEACEDILST